MPNEPIVSTRFALNFFSNIGRVVRLSIPRANTAKDEQEIRDAMQAIIDLEIVEMGGHGIPRSKKSAYTVETVRRAIPVPTA